MKFYQTQRLYRSKSGCPWCTRTLRKRKILNKSLSSPRCFRQMPPCRRKDKCLFDRADARLPYYGWRKEQCALLCRKRPSFYRGISFETRRRRRLELRPQSRFPVRDWRRRQMRGAYTFRWNNVWRACRGTFRLRRNQRFRRIFGRFLRGAFLKSRRLKRRFLCRSVRDENPCRLREASRRDRKARFCLLSVRWCAIKLSKALISLRRFCRWCRRLRPARLQN